MGKQQGHRESMDQKSFFSIRITGSCSIKLLLLVSCSGFLMEPINLYYSFWESWLLMIRAGPSLENCSLFLSLKGSAFP